MGVVKPKDVCLLIGVPVDKQTYIRHRDEPEGHDFVPRLCPTWAKYDREFIRPAQRLISHSRMLGVTVIEAATLADFEWGCKSLPVIVVLSHSDLMSMEFHDGMASVEHILSAIPEHFEGVLDLGVCKAIDLVKGGLVDRGCSLCGSSLELRPIVLTNLYETAFQLLEERNYSYLDALDEGASLILQR